jgi:putative flippase GtrA
MSAPTATPTATTSAPAWRFPAMSGVFRRLPSYALIGSVCTAAHMLIFWVLSEVMSAEVANAIAMLTTTIASTAANRRFTFGVTGTSGALRDQLGGLMAFLIALSMTTLSLAALPTTASQTTQLAAVLLANGLASGVRFTLLQAWIRNPVKAS